MADFVFNLGHFFVEIGSVAGLDFAVGSDSDFDHFVAGTGVVAGTAFAAASDSDDDYSRSLMVAPSQEEIWEYLESSIVEGMVACSKDRLVD